MPKAGQPLPYLSPPLISRLGLRLDGCSELRECRKLVTQSPRPSAGTIAPHRAGCSKAAPSDKDCAMAAVRANGFSAPPTQPSVWQTKPF